MALRLTSLLGSLTKELHIGHLKNYHFFMKLIRTASSLCLAQFYFFQKVQRSEREKLIQRLQSEIEKQTDEKLQFVKQEFYEVGESERRGDSLLELATEIDDEYPDALVIVVLWNGLMRNVYTELKNILKSSQCLSEKTFREITTNSDPKKASSKLCKLALGILTEVAVQPWVLADDLHHDLHIGIDVLDGKVAYHFLYGKGGRKICREIGRSSSGSKAKEAIKRFEIKKVLEKTIRLIVEEGFQLRNLIIHRDGRWWTSEKDGLAQAIKKLQEEEVLPPDFQYAVVEIRKNHLPIRLFTEAIRNGAKTLENPLPGTFLTLDSTRIVLTTTGRASWDKTGRTAGSLIFEIVDGNAEFDIEDITQDAFWLTHLNWNAPDIEIGLPVTIQWGDQALRETYYSPVGELEEEFEDMESDG
jgi:Piwi domain